MGAMLGSLLGADAPRELRGRLLGTGRSRTDLRGVMERLRRGAEASGRQVLYEQFCADWLAPAVLGREAVDGAWTPPPGLTCPHQDHLPWLFAVAVDAWRDDTWLRSRDHALRVLEWATETGTGLGGLSWEQARDRADRWWADRGPGSDVGTTVDLGDGWYVARLRDPRDLALEAAAMRNCLGEAYYAQRARSPGFQLLSLRGPDGLPRLTAEAWWAGQDWLSQPWTGPEMHRDRPVCGSYWVPHQVRQRGNLLPRPHREHHARAVALLRWLQPNLAFWGVWALAVLPDDVLASLVTSSGEAVGWRCTGRSDDQSLRLAGALGAERFRYLAEVPSLMWHCWLPGMSEDDPQRSGTIGLGIRSGVGPDHVTAVVELAVAITLPQHDPGRPMDAATWARRELVVGSHVVAPPADGIGPAADARAVVRCPVGDYGVLVRAMGAAQSMPAGVVAGSDGWFTAPRDEVGRAALDAHDRLLRELRLAGGAVVSEGSAMRVSAP